MSNYNLEELKLKLKTAKKLKLKSERNEFSLRSVELALSEEITLIRREIEFISQQLEDVKQQISQMNYQNTIIKICSESEMTKEESYTSNVNNHKNSFDLLFTKERGLLERQQKELREKEAEKDESERQKFDKVLEINEQKAKEAAAIEEECESIERECYILKKRNKAIMLKLRRKLIEAEETRRRYLNAEKLKSDVLRIN